MKYMLDNAKIALTLCEIRGIIIKTKYYIIIYNQSITQIKSFVKKEE